MVGPSRFTCHRRGKPSTDTAPLFLSLAAPTQSITNTLISVPFRTSAIRTVCAFSHKDSANTKGRSLSRHWGTTNATTSDDAAVYAQPRLKPNSRTNAKRTQVTRLIGKINSFTRTYISKREIASRFLSFASGLPAHQKSVILLHDFAVCFSFRLCLRLSSAMAAR